MTDVLFKNWDAQRTLEAIALIGAVIAFLMSLFQYIKAQKWKRAEWVAQEMKAILSDPLVDAAFKMIDWGGRNIQLYPNRANPEERTCHISSEEVINALRPHGGQPGFTEKEAAIRDAFDHLCDSLECIENYITTGLISESDVKPYIGYWGLHLRSDSKEPRHIRIRDFMKRYGYKGALELLDRFANI